VIANRCMRRVPAEGLPGESAGSNAATVPITDLYDGSTARDALGPDDLFLVLSENYASAICRPVAAKDR